MCDDVSGRSGNDGFRFVRTSSVNAQSRIVLEGRVLEAISRIA